MNSNSNESTNKVRMSIEQQTEVLRQSMAERESQPSDPMGSLRAAAGALDVIAVIVGVLGVIGGIFVAMQSQQQEVAGMFGSDTVTTHPYIGLGIGVAFSSIITAVLLWLLAAWASAWEHSNRD